MKKITKILLPIAGVAAVAAPTVCLTSCSAFHWNDAWCFLYIENIKFKDHQRWDVTIDYKNDWKSEATPIEGYFHFTNDKWEDSTKYVFSLDDLHVYVNDIELENSDWERDTSGYSIRIINDTIVKTLKDSKVKISSTMVVYSTGDEQVNFVAK